MAAMTHAVATADTANATSYASGAFTPAANDLLAVWVTAASTVATGTMTDSQGLGFTKIASAVYSTSTYTDYLFVANTLAANSSMTVTFDCTGDIADGACMAVERISGMTLLGASAVRQTAKQENQTTNSSPAPVFPGVCLTGNPTSQCLGILFNPAAMTPPVGWTEVLDSGHGTPVNGIEVSNRDSGFTGSTLTWTDTTGTIAWGILAAEFDASAGGGAAALPLEPAIYTTAVRTAAFW